MLQHIRWLLLTSVACRCVAMAGGIRLASPPAFVREGRSRQCSPLEILYFLQGPKRPKKMKVGANTQFHPLPLVWGRVRFFNQPTTALCFAGNSPGFCVHSNDMCSAFFGFSLGPHFPVVCELPFGVNELGVQMFCNMLKASPLTSNSWSNTNPAGIFVVCLCWR